MDAAVILPVLPAQESSGHHLTVNLWSKPGDKQYSKQDLPVLVRAGTPWNLPLQRLVLSSVAISHVQNSMVIQPIAMLN